MSKDKLGGGAEGREEAAHLIQWRFTCWVCHRWRHCVCWVMCVLGRGRGWFHRPQGEEGEVLGRQGEEAGRLTLRAEGVAIWFCCSEVLGGGGEPRGSQQWGRQQIVHGGRLS